MTGATDTNIRPSSRVVRSEAIVFTVLDDTVLMMDVEEGRYYALDPVGTRVWGLVESRPRVGAVYEVLATEYEVPPERCRDEVRGFMDRLLRLGVLRILPADDAEETGKDGARERFGAVSEVGKGLGSRGRREPGNRLTWTSPTIRIVPIAGTASGSQQVVSKYLEETDTGGSYNYRVIS